MQIQDLIRVSIPSNADLDWSHAISEPGPILKVCIYRSNMVSDKEVFNVMNKMFNRYNNDQIIFIIVGIMGNSHALEWIDQMQYEFETYDIPQGFAFKEMIRGGLDMFIEFNRRGLGTSVLAQQMESAGIYTYIVDL